MINCPKKKNERIVRIEKQCAPEICSAGCYSLEEHSHQITCLRMEKSVSLGLEHKGRAAGPLRAIATGEWFT